MFRRYLSLAVFVAALPATAAPTVAPTPAHPVPTTTGVAASATPADFGRVSLMVNALARELAEACPFAAADDEKALQRCKSALYRPQSALRQQLPEYVLWGRRRNLETALKDTHLTQFGKDVFSATYLPLFMFNGKYEIVFDEREKLHRVEFVTAFRNRLKPGEFPYPFWHDENKWATYQGANRLTLWVGFDDGVRAERIKAIQFSVFGQNHAAMPTPIPTPAFDKDTHAKWLWTDAEGKTQPQVTLFDGLYRADNPHLKRLDETYRAIALELRDGNCMSCHVPDNPDKMKRLVLLQTPAHAASEIGRVIKSVRQDKMPLDDIGLEKPMPTEAKATLLAKAEAFNAAIEAAKAWEAAPGKPGTPPRQKAAPGAN